MFGFTTLLYRNKWTRGERVFASCCYLGKAAFQASLGSSILELGKEMKIDYFIDKGYDILAISVVIILVASTIGSSLSI